MKRTDDEVSKTPTPAFDYSEWHTDPKCDVDVLDGGNGKLYVRCRFHDVVADLEAVGQRLTIAASAH